MAQLKLAIRRAVQLAIGGVAVAVYVLVAVPWSRVAERARRASGRLPRIVWGPIPVVNIRYTSLADRTQGYSSESVVYGVYAINARVNFDRVLDRLAKIPLLREVTPFAAFFGGAFRYDVFGFFFDGGFLWATPFWRLELALLKLARKRILVYPYGSDARLASKTRARGHWHAYSDVHPGAEDRDESEVQARLDAFSRYADVMLGCADLYEDLPRCDGIIRYAFDDAGWEPVPPTTDGDVVRVVHAPNHRHYKGTRFLIDAISALQSDGCNVALDLVEGIPTEAAREIYRRADIVADQFLIGAYALLSIEGMALGKPVVCYLNERFYAAHPEWRECPIVSANPDELADTLRALVFEPERRRELGARGPAYVRKFHSLVSVGKDLDHWYGQAWS
jgi:glycosyltransferase involved in cell wall biosynthesis